MAKHKMEVILKGEFTTVDVCLEGIEVPLREINDNDYYWQCDSHEIKNLFDVRVRLKGWFGMVWELKIIVDNIEKYNRKNTFDETGFVKFKDQIRI